MEEIDTIQEKETTIFFEIYNKLLSELSHKYAEGFILGPIPEILKRSLLNNFKKSILAADKRIDQTYSMNKTIIDFIKARNFTKLHLELIEFDDEFRKDQLQNRSARLEFACSFDNEKDKYLLMDVQKEIVLTDPSGNFIFTNEFSTSLQPILDKYVDEEYDQLGNKKKNTRIITVEKSYFTELLGNFSSSSIKSEIIFYPAIIKDRDIPLYQRINIDVIRYKDQFSLFMAAKDLTGIIPADAQDTFCLNPPDKC